MKIIIAHHVKLDGEAVYRNFEKVLKRGLTRSGAELIVSEPLLVSKQLLVPKQLLVSEQSQSAQETAILVKIIDLKFSSQGVSRDTTGRANEHEVTLRLDYQVNGASAETVKAERDILSLSATASYYQDYHNPTAGRVQKNETHRLLLSQLSQRLIRQVELQLRNQ